MDKETIRLGFVSVAMIAAGMILAEGGASMGQIVLRFELSGLRQGLLVSTRFIGGLAMGFTLWVAGAEHIRVERAIGAALFLIVATAPLLLVDAYWSALTVATARGLAIGIAIPMSGVYVGRQERWRPGFVAALTNATLSIGLVAATVAANTLQATGRPDWRLYWLAALIPALAASVLGLLVALRNARVARGESGRHSPHEHRRNDGYETESAGRSRPAERLHRSMAATSWRYVLGSGLIVSGESVLFGYLPFLTALRAGSGGGGEGYAVALMTAILVGRLVSVQLFRVVRAPRLFAAHVVTLIGALTFWALAPAALLGLAVVVAGLGASAVFPGLIAVASEDLGNRSGTTIAGTGWAGGIGGTLFPALTGAALGAGLAVPAVGAFIAGPVAVAAVVVTYTRRRNRETRARTQP